MTIADLAAYHCLWLVRMLNPELVPTTGPTWNDEYCEESNDRGDPSIPAPLPERAPSTAQTYIRLERT